MLWPYSIETSRYLYIPPGSVHPSYYKSSQFPDCPVEYSEVQLMLLEILSHDDDENDLGQANDDDQPFGLNPGY